MPKQSLATIIYNKKIANGIYAVTLKEAVLAKNAAPGQFIHVKCGDGSLLRRPISISDVQNDMLTIVVETRGEGTKWLAARQAGDCIDVLGPLGRGFDISGKNIILVGGGIGVPPMLFTARSAIGRTTAVLGFRNKDCVILEEEIRSVCHEVFVTTDDGSYQEHGTVSKPIERLLKNGKYDGVLACGPRAMLKATAELCAAYQIPCQVSMEERMGCGIGACLVCACKTQKDGKEHMSHVCKDGPVFLSSEVVW